MQRIEGSNTLGDAKYADILKRMRKYLFFVKRGETTCSTKNSGGEAAYNTVWTWDVVCNSFA